MSLQLKCGQYGIKYVRSDINEGFNKILTTYLVERSKFGSDVSVRCASDCNEARIITSTISMLLTTVLSF